MFGLAVSCHFAFAYEIRGKVVAIADGDTITVLDADYQQHKIRLSGIDAPEKKQAFGQKSKAYLSTLVFSRNVRLDCRKRDKYRREICVVFVDEQDANLEQIKVGLAWWYRQYAKDQTELERQRYEQAELNAKNRRVGLWADSEQIPPWEWRHKRKLGSSFKVTF